MRPVTGALNTCRYGEDSTPSPWLYPCRPCTNVPLIRSRGLPFPAKVCVYGRLAKIWEAV